MSAHAPNLDLQLARGRSIRTQIAAALAVSVFVTAASVVAVSTGYGIQLTREDFDTTTEAVTEQFADNASFAMETRSQPLLAQMVDRISKHPDVHALRFFDPREVREGVPQPLVAHDGRPWGTHVAGDLLSREEVSRSVPEVAEQRKPTARTLEVAGVRVRLEPIFLRPLDLPEDLYQSGAGEPVLSGVLAIQLDESRLLKAEARIVTAALGMTLLLATALMPLAYWLSRRLTAPLEALVRTVRASDLSSDRFVSDPRDPAELASLKSALQMTTAQAERRLAALESSERRAREVFESSQDGMAMVTPDAKLVAVNLVMKRYFRRSELPENVESLLDAFPTKPSIAKRMNEALETGFQEIESCVLGTGPTARTGLLRLSRLESDEEALLLAVFLDRTEALAEESRRRELEQRLRQGQKLEALGVMAGGIAHDFNNQLNIMLGNLLLLRQDVPLNAGTQPLFDDLEGATRHCVDLTRQLVTFARRGADTHSEDKVFAMRDLVTETLRLLRRTLPPSIELSSHIDDGLWNPSGDRTRMQQVLMNLCLNASDALEQGGSLTVHCSNRRQAKDERHDDEKSCVVIEVRDTGHGMTPDVLERVFDPFFTTKDLGRGAGLGLSTSFGIVRNHGGWIEVESEEDRGTVFRVFWPASPDACVSPEKHGDPVPRGHERVLVAEDDEQLRNLTRSMLKRQGYRVQVAPDGEEALRIHRSEQPFELLVLDILMPGTGGAEVLKTLRSGGDRTPVVLTSGHADGHELTRLIAHYGAAFLSKPYTPQDLARKVRDTLDNRPAVIPEASVDDR